MTLHIDPALQWGLALSILAVLAAWMVLNRPVHPAQPAMAPSVSSASINNEEVRSVINWPDLLRLGLPTLRMTEPGTSGFSLKTLQSLFYAVTNIQITDPRTFLAAQIPVLNTAPEPTPVVWTPPSRSGDIPFTPAREINEPPEGDLSPSPAETLTPPESSSPAEPAKPSIFIYHSHNAEAYRETSRDYVYNDDSQTIMRVGQELVKELERLGVTAVQDGTHHMDVKFNDAYMNSRKTVQAALKANPDYKMVLDVHRDGDVEQGITTTMINGEPVANILIMVGTNEVLGHKNWKQNEAFAKALHKKLEELYPGLSRGIRYEELARYNQDLHPNALLLEIGGNLNSMEEALRGARYLARALAELSK